MDSLNNGYGCHLEVIWESSVKGKHVNEALYSDCITHNDKPNIFHYITAFHVSIKRTRSLHHVLYESLSPRVGHTWFRQWYCHCMIIIHSIKVKILKYKHRFDHRTGCLQHGAVPTLAREQGGNYLSVSLLG